MKPGVRLSRGAAVLAIAATYFFFLLFAEFAFLALASEVAPGAARLRVVMLTLGLSGVAGSLAAAAVFRPGRAQVLLTWAFLGCSAAGAIALVASHVAALLISALVGGASLGALTVTLAATLRRATGASSLALCIGCGTGLAYAVCNLPWVFHASATVQTLLATVVAAVGSALPRFFVYEDRLPLHTSDQPQVRAAQWITILLALVWLDSAAFYIVQHTPALRDVTWRDPVTLLANATVHLGAAIVAGWWLDRGLRRLVAALALLSLILAGLILNGTLRASLPANLFYTAGVSLYSVLLVEVPARSGRPWLAAGVYSIAGWVGSALGIGMAQDLARIPTAFLVVAVAAVAVALLWRSRAAVRIGVAVIAVAAIARGDEIADGREVYIAEGCLHCHSQYLRPRVAREMMDWGPGTPWREALQATPPLFGTRRQGPDLSQVGNRRSPEWNRLHLIAPRAVSPGSRMPSYAHLFAPDETRGDALLAYLASLGAENAERRRGQIAAWTPDTRDVVAPATAAKVFAQLCTPCHGATGRGDGVLAPRLSVRPPDWARESWRRVGPGESVETALSRIIKFGVPGLPMAGHEYLPDGEIVGLARHVRSLHKESGSASSAAARP